MAICFRVCAYAAGAPWPRLWPFGVMSWCLFAPGLELTVTLISSGSHSLAASRPLRLSVTLRAAPWPAEIFASCERSYELIELRCLSQGCFFILFMHPMRFSCTLMHLQFFMNSCYTSHAPALTMAVLVCLYM